MNEDPEEIKIKMVAAGYGHTIAISGFYFFINI